MIRTLKSKKGITIIALIITVVVLLILAGISVSLVVDKDGLLNSSKETKEEVRAISLNKLELLNAKRS